MKTEHDFFGDYIDCAVGDENIAKVNRIYNLIHDYISPKVQKSLFDAWKRAIERYNCPTLVIEGKNLFTPQIDCPPPYAQQTSDSFVRILMSWLSYCLVDRLKATLHADPRFTMQEVRDKSWEFEQEYKDKELDLDEIGGDLEEYTTRIVNDCYRPPLKYDEE